MKAISYILQVKVTVYSQISENKRGQVSGNKHSNSGCTAFYSDGDPGVRIFIGAPFSWDRVHASAGCMCIRCSSHSRVRGAG